MARGAVMAGTQALRPVGVALELPVLRVDALDRMRARVGADVLRVLRLNGAMEMGGDSVDAERERALGVLRAWTLTTVPLFRVGDDLVGFSARDVAGVLQVARTERAGRVLEHALLVVHRDRLVPVAGEGDMVAAAADEATIAGQNERLLYFVRQTSGGAALSAAGGGTTVFEAHGSSRARAPDATSAVVDDRGAQEVTGAGRVDTVVVRVASGGGEVVLRAPAVAVGATAGGATVYAGKAVAVRTNLPLTVRALLHAFVPDPREIALDVAQTQAPLAAAVVPLEADTSGAARGLGFAFGERRGAVRVDVGAGWTGRVARADAGTLAAAARVLQYPVAGLVLGVHVVQAVIGRSGATARREAEHAAGVAAARALVEAYTGAVVDRVRELAALGEGVAAGLGPWLGLYRVAGAAGAAAMELEPRAAAATDAAVVEGDAAAGAARVEVTAAPGETLAVGDGATAVEAVAVVARDAVVSASDDGVTIEAAGPGPAVVVVTTASGKAVDVEVPVGAVLEARGDGAVAVAADGDGATAAIGDGVVAAATGGGAALAAGDDGAAVGASDAAEAAVEVKVEAPAELVAVKEELREDNAVAEMMAAAAEAGVPPAPGVPVLGRYRAPSRAATQAELAQVLGEVRRLAQVEDAGLLRTAVVVLAERVRELEMHLRRRG